MENTLLHHQSPFNDRMMKVCVCWTNAIMCQLRVFVCMRVWDYLRCHFNRTMSAKFVRSQKNQNWIIVNAIKKMFFMTVIETRECISCSSHYITLGYVYLCVCLFIIEVGNAFYMQLNYLKHFQMFKSI